MTRPPYAYRRTTATKAKRQTPEFDLQCAAYQYLTYALPDGYQAYSTLNGVYLTPKVRNDAARTGFRAGPLDIMIMGGGKTRWLEAKVHPRKMSAEQLEFAAMADPSDWGLFYTIEEMVEILTGRFGLVLRAVRLS